MHSGEQKEQLGDGRKTLAARRLWMRSRRHHVVKHADHLYQVSSSMFADTSRRLNSLLR
jgi:hypothetical protein